MAEEVMVNKVGTDSIANWVLRSAVGLLFIWSSWMTSAVLDLQYAQAEVSANRFTASDGLLMARSLLEMERSIRADMPPEEWRKRIISLEECQIKLELGKPC